MNTSKSNADDVGKYKKKKESDVSKSRRKSKHKHLYEQCLLKVSDDAKHISGALFKGKYCTICGKIADVRHEVIRDGVRGYYRMLTSSELEDKYSEYPKFVVDDICQEYLELEEES